MARTFNPHPVTQNGAPDRRYRIGLEFTGHASGKPQYVVRFCGEFIGSGTFYSTALMCATGHNQRRLGALTIEGIPA
ncbi:MAG: hypothetical protein V4521_02180 [Pseudomonadota bacterium]